MRPRDIRSSVWRRPDTAELRLEYSIAHSVVEEFVLSHQPSDVLTELVQNEFDAGGSRVEVAFGEASLSVSGNGAPVDSAGWKRLSVMLGRGQVAGSDRVIKPKTNNIGSKNWAEVVVLVRRQDLHQIRRSTDGVGPLSRYTSQASA